MGETPDRLIGKAIDQDASSTSSSGALTRARSNAFGPKNCRQRCNEHRCGQIFAAKLHEKERHLVMYDRRTSLVCVVRKLSQFLPIFVNSSPEEVETTTRTYTQTHTREVENSYCEINHGGISPSNFSLLISFLDNIRETFPARGAPRN